MQSSRTYTNNFLHSIFGTDMRLFEVSVWIQAAALSLVSVFVPVILYKAGLSIREVFGFYLLFCAIDIPLNLLARKLILRFGARTTMIIAIIAQIIYFGALFAVHPMWWSVLMTAFFLALYDSFYWVSSLYIFLRSEENKRVSLDVGAVNIVRAVGGLLAPAIGALIFLSISPHALLAIAALTLLCSLAPLFLMKQLKFIPERKPDSFRHFFSQPLERANYFFEGLSAMQQEMEDVFWPFFIFFIYSSVRQMALIPILVAAGDIVLTYVTAKFTMRANLYRLVSRGAVAVMVIWLLRVFAPTNPYIIFGSVFLISLLSILIELPLEVSVFERGQKIDPLNAVTWRNFFRMCARFVLYGLVLVFSFIGQNPFKVSFTIITLLLVVLWLVSLSVSMFTKDFQKLVPEPIIEEAD